MWCRQFSRSLRTMAPKRKLDASATESSAAKTAVHRSGSAVSKPTPGQPGITALGDGAELLYQPQLLDAAPLYLERLLKEIDWKQREVTVMGRKMMQPRLTDYQASSEQLSYTYSGTKHTPAPFHELVALIKEKVEAAAGCRFNSCLLNMYRDGADSLSWHSDNEKEYGAEPTIASVSLGATRDFLFRRNSDRSEKFVFALQSGDLLVMRGTVQQNWMHAVPKRRGVDSARINLTFRNVVP